MNKEVSEKFIFILKSIDESKIRIIEAFKSVYKRMQDAEMTD